MSINVTVTGNPVSIKKGKMVTYSSDNAKKEFDKRRLMRLEQVRHQSKEIAENVRKRVQNEKKKQLSAIEREGEENLREWQARKLLELQDQYQERLRDIGLGHEAAKQALEEESEEERSRQMANVVAKERGDRAAEKLLRDKILKDSKLVEANRRKKLVRSMEDARSSLVSRINKKSSPKKKKKNIVSMDISTSNVVVDSDDCTSSGSVDHSDNTKHVTPHDEEETASSTSTASSFSRSEDSALSSSTDQSLPHQSSIVEKRTTKQQTTRKETIEGKPQSPTRKVEQTTVTTKCVEYPLDTRITDRIKHRSVPSTDMCDVFALQEEPEEPRHVIHSNPSTSKPSLLETRQTQTSTSLLISENTEVPLKDFKKRETVQKSANELPPRPTVSIQSNPNVAASHGASEQCPCPSTSKITHYDYTNKFSKEEYSSRANVQKIEAESIQVISSSNSDADFQKLMNKRDKDAETRGKRALEKEKIQREYKELMQKLPLLQKQERIINIFSDKQKYHMSEDRLKHTEEKRQAHMENAYEQLFPPPPRRIVTLPQQPTVPNENYTSSKKGVTINENITNYSYGKWDVDSRECNTSTTPNTRDSGTSCSCQMEKACKLKTLLKDLHTQKEQILQEISCLPKDGHLDDLINQLSDVEEKESGRKKGVKRTTEHQTSGSELSDTEHRRVKKPKKTVCSTAEKHKKALSDSSTNSVVSPSPKKKSRMKLGKLILQNTSTQTTPKTERVIGVAFDKGSKTIERATSPVKGIAVKSTVSPRKTCSCTKISESKEDKVCEIVIKIKENESEPEIHITPKDESSHIEEQRKKQVPTKKKDRQAKHVEEKYVRPNRKEQKHFVSVNEKTDTINQSTWQQQLTQSSIHTSSSTSYYSPPDIENLHGKNDHKKTGKTGVSKRRPRDILQEKPQQSNISVSSTVASFEISNKQQKINPIIIKYIEKLLTMRHASIENLDVSSVSSISTPSQTVMDTASNYPLVHLHNLMKSFNVSLTDLRKHFGYLPDDSHLHHNTLESLTESVASTGKVNVFTTVSEKSTTSNRSSSSLDSIDSKEPNVESSNDYLRVTAEYAKIAESCNKRILSLAAMIEKVRREKDIMLQSPDTSDKENSTAYLDIPTKIFNDSTDSAKEQERLNEELLRVDYNVAEFLDKTSPDQLEALSQYLTTELPQATHDVDKELTLQFKNLLAVNKESKQPDVPFVPLLRDIPKLPKLSPPKDTLRDPKKGKKPPASKGILVAKRFNGDISALPHELSIIPEADSQLSVKVAQPLAKDRQQKKSSDESMPDILVELIDTAKAHAKGSPKKNRSSDSGQVQVVSSDSSAEKSSDMETVEAMLRKMGMGWAIATLKKTQEALALTSSSSSMDISIKQKEVRLTDSSSSSEVSLKEILGKQFLAKFTSTMTSTNDSSFSSLLKEFQDISAIQGGSGSTKDKASQRTSTPVLTCKGVDKGEAINLIGESSDLSSVKEQGEPKRRH